MWSLVHNNDINRYLSRYSALHEHAESVVLYQNEEYSFLPRYFKQSFPSELLIPHIDTNWSPVEISGMGYINTFRLREEQIPICQKLINVINTGDKVGVLKARPGAGKTIMAIFLSCHLKKKTLIVLDNSKLAEQWIKAICSIATIDGELITEDQIGIIQGPKFDVNPQTPFTIAMVQTLISKVKRQMNEFYIKVRDQGFDLVYFDECHKASCGPKYAKASLLLNTKNVIGLSATPFVVDIHKILLNNTIGDIVAEHGEYNLVPVIKYVHYDTQLTDKYYRFVKYSGDFLQQRSRYNSILPKSETYKSIILQITKAMLDEGRRIIIIVFTVKQLTEISSWLTDIGITNCQLYSKKTEINKDVDRVVVATYGFAGAGFDYEELSVAIIASPLAGKKSLIQVIGRILRSFPDKLQPIVFDLIDDGFKGMFTKDLSNKISIVQNEFKCRIEHLNV